MCDVPAVVESGAALAAEEGAADRLRFTTAFADASGADVLLAAGSLQYVETPLAELLGGLASPPAHILINKTPTHATREFVTLQNIGLAFCPYRIHRRDALPASLQAIGYELVDSWENADLRCEVPFHPDAGPIVYVGHYFRRQ